MSAPWWTRERDRAAEPRMVAGVPELLPAAASAVLADLRARDGYTPTWGRRGPDDAGTAFDLLFSKQMQALRQRLNGLPGKARVELLRLAGVEPLGGTTASALLQFTVSTGAGASVLIPEGFQVGGQPPGEDLVTFETDQSIYVAPAEIAQVILRDQKGTVEIDAKEVTGGTATFLPFGRRPRAGNAIYIGLSGTVVPYPFVTLGVAVAAPPGAPPPASAGTVAETPAAVIPVLQWEVLDQSRFEPAEVVEDETGGLVRSGLVTLRVPRRWRTGRVPGVPDANELRWIGLRVFHGAYASPPQLRFIGLNVVRASAARTIRNEVLLPVADGENRRYRLSQAPVLPESLFLEVDESSSPELVDATGSTAVPWTRVDDLSQAGPDARVYVLDATTGEVTFGDGMHGAPVPRGFRNVRARSYRVPSVLRGRLEAGDVSTLINSAPFLTGVANPFAATGGGPGETRDQTVARGPQDIRARGRAVTVADVALLATRAPGALVRRAHAVSGLHPAFPGLPIPGVIGVLLVSDAVGRGLPIPDEETLRKVSEYIATVVGPVGVEIVSAAPRFHRIQIEAAIVVREGASVGDTVAAVLERLDSYLDPLRGGEERNGWTFGGPIRYSRLQRLLLSGIDGVEAIRHLTMIADGIRQPACTDFITAPHALVWPAGHTVLPSASERTS